jgi:hypothetical protein
VDLVRLICAGAGNRFGGVVCKFYVRLTAECDLLKNEKLDPIFKNGRCNPYLFLKSAIEKNLKRYKDVINVREYVSSIPLYLCILQEGPSENVLQLEELEAFLLLGTIKI